MVNRYEKIKDDYRLANAWCGSGVERYDLKSVRTDLIMHFDELNTEEKEKLLIIDSLVADTYRLYEGRSEK